jgi:hypothetical protein
MRRLTPLSKLLLVVAAIFVVVALFAGDAGAQGVRAFDFNTATASVTLTTTTENVAVSSRVLNTPRDEVEVVVVCYMQVTTGTMTTGLIPRIRRGSAITGTLISEENTITVGAAAGSTEQLVAMVSEQRTATNVQYSCTADQVAADGDGAVIYSSILVLVR